MPLRSIFAHHFWLKLLSLVLSCLIWLTVKANIGTTASKSMTSVIATKALHSETQRPAGMTTTCWPRCLCC